MSKIEMIKKLEYLVAFQANCLEKGQWEEFDRIQSSILSLEKSILEAEESINWGYGTGSLLSCNAGSGIHVA